MDKDLARVTNRRKARGWMDKGAKAEAPEWQGPHRAGSGCLAASESLMVVFSSGQFVSRTATG